MLIDLLITLVIIYAIARNWGTGLISQLFSALGLIGGLFLGRLLETYTVTLAHTPTSRTIIIIISIFGVGLAGLNLGQYTGLKLKRRLAIKRFNIIDNYLGSILTALTVLVIVWLTASVIGSLPATRIKYYVKSSNIIAELDKLMPPAPSVIARLGRVIDPNGFPDVFIGSEPVPNTKITTPSLGEMLKAINADRASVVKVEGTGCGGIVTGSGFIVGEDLVATNAHVVAGIASPYVIDINGRHSTSVIWFDPNLDLAILKTSRLAGNPLKLSLNDVSSGTAGAVLGYPGGGSFQADSAAVIDEFTASGRNIYGSSVTIRSVYEISAKVIPGNSGGPLINKDGDVMGVVFAQSTAYSDVGYALTMPKVASEINQAKARTASVSTGQCAE